MKTAAAKLAEKIQPLFNIPTALFTGIAFAGFGLSLWMAECSLTSGYLMADDRSDNYPSAQTVTDCDEGYERHGGDNSPQATATATSSAGMFRAHAKVEPAHDRPVNVEFPRDENGKQILHSEYVWSGTADLRAQSVSYLGGGIGIGPPMNWDNKENAPISIRVQRVIEVESEDEGWIFQIVGGIAGSIVGGKIAGIPGIVPGMEMAAAIGKVIDKIESGIATRREVNRILEDETERAEVSVWGVPTAAKAAWAEGDFSGASFRVSDEYHAHIPGIAGAE